MAQPGYIDNFYELGAASPIAPVWPVIWTVIKILCVLLPLMGLVAYATLWERKLIGWIQIRVGPNRVGPMGLLQPIADAPEAAAQRNRDPGESHHQACSCSARS